MFPPSFDLESQHNELSLKIYSSFSLHHLILVYPSIPCPQALPVLWLYWQTAHGHCRSPPHTLLCQSLRLQALTHLHMFPEALSLLGEVLRGRGVPQVSCDCDIPSDSSDITAAAAGFSDSLPLTHTSNVKVCILTLITTNFARYFWDWYTVFLCCLLCLALQSCCLLFTQML